MKSLLLTLFLLPAATSLFGQANGIDAETLIERILTVEDVQRARLQDVVFDAEYVEGEYKDGVFEEKSRFVKKIYLKFLPDTVLFSEEYVEYYRDGSLQNEKQLAKEAEKQKDKKKKRKARDISYPMLAPFQPEHRAEYDITYMGVADESIEGKTCHRFSVRAKEKEDDLINGEFYFDAETFHLVRADFSPAKLTNKFIFKLKQLDMSLTYMETADGFWLPSRFDVDGKGKAGFFFGVNFGGTEYYRNPIVNGGVDDARFEESDDE